MERLITSSELGSYIDHMRRSIETNDMGTVNKVATTDVKTIAKKALETDMTENLNYNMLLFIAGTVIAVILLTLD